MQQSSVPTVEEILDAIKQVIARDNRLDARSAAPRSTTARSNTGAAAVESRGSSARGQDDVLDLASIEGLGAEASETDSAADASAELLLAADARNAMRESLAALAMLSEPRAQPQIVRSGETSLEAMTRELLRPALTEWLDQHLPALVERLVAAEIARIVGKKA